MRFLAAAARALARALVQTTALVWEGGRWILRAVSGAQPDPVLPAAAAAEEYLDAAAAPVAHVGGLRALNTVGVTLVMHARHLTQGGDAVDVSALPEETQIWLASLSRDELAVLARATPRDAQAHLDGRPVPGLPALGDGPAADMSRVDADVSVLAWTMPPTGDPEADDIAMRDIRAFVQSRYAA